MAPLSSFQRHGEATAIGGRAQACAEHGGGPPFLMHCLPAAPSPSVEVEVEEAGWKWSAPRSAGKMIRNKRTASRPVEGRARAVPL